MSLICALFITVVVQLLSTATFISHGWSHIHIHTLIHVDERASLTALVISSFAVNISAAASTVCVIFVPIPL